MNKELAEASQPQGKEKTSGQAKRSKKIRERLNRFWSDNPHCDPRPKIVKEK